MEQYLALTRGNQAPGVVKPENRGNVNFEIKSQFMWELREDSFFGNKNDDAHEHVERVLDIVSLFPGVSHDAVMLRVFPITLTGAAKRWVDRLPPRTVDSWDLLKKAFIQRYCPPSKTANQLEEIRNFKQEGDETLYQAWERYNDLLYKCPTHDINNHQKEVDNQPKKTEIPSQNEKLCNREKEKTEQNQAKVQKIPKVRVYTEESAVKPEPELKNTIDILTFALVKGIWLRFAFVLFYMYTITRTTPVQALTAIQNMADHSQKWHDGSSNKNIESSKNSEGIAAIVNKLENLGRDMKKLKENVHAILVGCQTCEGAHLDKYCPLNKEVKGMKEVKYGEFSRPFPNNRYDGRFNKGGYDEPSSGEKRPNLTEIINKYMVEASKRQAEQDEWLKKFYQSTEASRETHDKIIQGLEGKEIEYFSTNSGFSDNEEQETDDSRMTHCSTLEGQHYKKKREEPKKVKQNVNYYVDPYEPPMPFPKQLEHHAEEALEQDPESFILSCSIGKLDFKNALADLGASIRIMPFSMYKRLGIGKLKPINMLIEIADNTKCTPKGIVENLLIKIDKFIFPVDFVILDMVEDIRMPIILGRPLLATTHVQVDIFRKTISLEVGSEKVIYKMRSSFTTTNFKYVRSIKSETFVEDDYLKEIDYDLFLYDSESYYWRERFRDEEDDLDENLEDLEECGEDKANTILGVIHDKLNNDWFNNTSEDEDDLEGILDYLKPRSYDGFINLDDEAYNKRRRDLHKGSLYEEMEFEVSLTCGRKGKRGVL
ncbi:zinc knuckle CX2CX4HX4C containing protein [Tanacetum coccineum]